MDIYENPLQGILRSSEIWYVNNQIKLELINVIGCLTIQTTSLNREGVYTLVVSNVHGSSNRSLDVKFYHQNLPSGNFIPPFHVFPSAAAPVAKNTNNTAEHYDQSDHVTTLVYIRFQTTLWSFYFLKSFLQQEVMALSIGSVGLAIICIIAVLIWLRILFLKQKRNERLHRLSTIVSLR